MARLAPGQYRARSTDSAATPGLTRPPRLREGHGRHVNSTGTSHRRDRLGLPAPGATVTYQYRAKPRHETATAAQPVPDSDCQTRAAAPADSDCRRTAAGFRHDSTKAPAAPATAAGGRATANPHGPGTRASYTTTRQGRPAPDDTQETNLTWHHGPWRHRANGGPTSVTNNSTKAAPTGRPSGIKLDQAPRAAAARRLPTTKHGPTASAPVGDHGAGPRLG